MRAPTSAPAEHAPSVTWRYVDDDPAWVVRERERAEARRRRERDGEASVLEFPAPNDRPARRKETA